MFGRNVATQTLGTIPDGVPVLSRGRHRNPRKGACFMEMASYLAGEKWSDHPHCTHPVLASLARCVNDALGDERRQELARMIPEVVGLHPDDPRVPAMIMRRSALAALPIAAAERQNVMALAVIGAEQHLAALDGRPAGSMTPEAQEALEHVPGSERWARDFSRRAGGGELRADSAAKVIALAVNGVARACVDDAADRLVTLLRTAIDETRTFMPVPVPVEPPTAPAVAPAPTRAVVPALSPRGAGPARDARG